MEHAGRRVGKGGIETAVVQTERHPITWSRVTVAAKDNRSLHAARPADY